MMHHSFALHLYGMGVNFLVCALLLYIFVATAVADTRIKDELIAKTREKIMRDEQLVGIASLTANTAHALGTPLQTMTIVVDDLNVDEGVSAKDVAVLRSQLAVCRQYLRQLVHTASVAGGGEALVLPIKDVVARLQEHYQLQSAKSDMVFNVAEACDDYGIKYSDALFFALINLIDNSLRACENYVHVNSDIRSRTWRLTITNDGLGLPEGFALESSRPFAVTANGLGLGVYLSNYTIEQNGGRLNVQNGNEAGAVTAIELPASKL